MGSASTGRFLLAAAALLIPLSSPAPAQPAEAELIRIALLKQLENRPPALSNLDEVPPDLGVSGSRLAVADNNTTGRFTKQRFEVEEVVVPADGDPTAEFARLVEQGHRIFVADLDAAALLALADRPDAKETLIFNARAKDDRLRNEDCRPNVLHTIPSRAMLADALAQYLGWKR